MASVSGNFPQSQRKSLIRTYASNFPVLGGFSIAAVEILDSSMRFKHGSVIVDNIFACWTSSLSAAQINVVRE